MSAMRAFAALLDGLGYTQSRNRKIALLGRYFRDTADPDRGWALAALTEGVPVRLPLRRMLSELTGRFIDPVLYQLSRDYVGDTAETVALLWPDFPLASVQREPHASEPQHHVAPLPFSDADLATKLAPPEPGEGLSLGDAISLMQTGTVADRTRALGQMLNALDASSRWALLKLIGGAPRVGVSAGLARTALAASYRRDVTEIEEIWHALTPPYLELFAWLDGRAEKPDPGRRPVFRPVMLAHPIGDDDWQRLSPGDFAAEWKWDGIRVQIAARAGEVRIFSRQGDDISATFPDIHSAFLGLDCVADGELLVMRNGKTAPFNDLQQRLNRKSVSAKLLKEFPAHVRLYDLLLDEADDLRPLPFAERRARLVAWHRHHHPAPSDVSPLVDFATFDDLNRLWQSAREDGIEGLMLKRLASSYQSGRVKGEWFKWKRAALTLDCVLMYAQRGSGKRSSFYSDYTFGVWRDDDAGVILVPVGKAYFGFTDEELRELDRWIRGHTTETFGPVRAVAPELVLEIAFDAIQPSARHKSGLAMRFPRIHRIRWDKPAKEADTLEAAKALVGRG